jgi:hypothetical protein
MMWTRVESSVWMVFLFVSVCLGSAQAQTSAVDQKVEAKVVTKLRQNARTHWAAKHAAMSRFQ